MAAGLELVQRILQMVELPVCRFVIRVHMLLAVEQLLFDLVQEAGLCRHDGVGGGGRRGGERGSREVRVEARGGVRACDGVFECACSYSVCCLLPLRRVLSSGCCSGGCSNERLFDGAAESECVRMRGGAMRLWQQRPDWPLKRKLEEIFQCETPSLSRRRPNEFAASSSARATQT